MFDKKLNVIAIIIFIVIGLSLACTFVTSAETTKFNTEFMEGSFIGNVDLENDSESYMHSYADSKNGIVYNISTVDDTVSLMEIYELQGVIDPTKVTVNGNEWNVYFSKAVSNDNEEQMDIVICQSQKDKQGYLIYAIFYGGSYEGSYSTSDESYIQYIQPLLKSLKLKDSSNVPKINDEFGLSEMEFQKEMDKIHAYKNGDTSALDDSAFVSSQDSSTPSSSSSQTYWASANSDKFHNPSCEWAQKISGKNKIVFNSRDEALNNGYQPCEVCNP